MSEFDIQTATREELEEQAAVIGVPFAKNISDKNLRKKISEALGLAIDDDGDDDKPAEKPKAAPKAAQASGKRVRVKIHKHERDKQPVQVSVNGVTILIERGKEVSVKPEYVEVLRNAMKMELDPDTNEFIEVPSYSFEVLGEA